MEITKITTQARNPNRVSLYIDGKFYRGLDRLVAVKLGLKPGIVLNPHLVQQLENTQTHHSAWEYALGLLRRSSKSVWMMHQKLLTKFDEDTVKATIDRLVETKMLDDTKLATSLVRYATEQGIKSRRQIIAKLQSKRIPRDIIDVAVGVDNEYETGAALRLAQRKDRQLKDLPWRQRYEKLGAYLAGRGFSYAVIKQVVREELLEPEQLA